MVHWPNSTASVRLRKARAQGRGGLRCERATPHRQRDLALGRRAIQRQGRRRRRGHRPEVPVQRPDVAPGQRAGQRLRDPQRTGIGERLLDEAAVDRERARLVEAGNATELGNRVEESHEAAGGEDRGRVVRGLRPGGEANRDGTDGLGHLPERGGQLLVAFDRDRGPAQRLDRALDVREGHERVECAGLRPGCHRRLEDLGTQRPRGVDDGLPAVQAQAARDDRDRVVGDGDDDELGVIEDRRGLGERSNARHERPEAVAPGRISRRDRTDDPAGAIQRHAEGRPDSPGADDPDDRRLARLGVDVRMAVRFGVIVHVRARRARLGGLRV